MTEQQENKNSMYYAVIRNCTKFEEVWSGMPAFDKACNRFKGIFQDIQETNTIQLKNITGFTDAKHREEYEMIALTLGVASSLKAYASMVKNDELKKRVKCTPSGLKLMKDTVLKNTCNMIMKAGFEFGDSLLDYGTTVDDLKQLQKEIADYEAVIAAPRDALNARADATAKLVKLFNEADMVLKEQLDELINLFKTKHPDFYAQYQNARRIVDLGVGHKKEEEVIEE